MSAEALDAALVRGELDQILVSKQIAKAQSLGQLLQYLVDRALAGGPPVTEEKIAADVFGRDDTFVAQVDPIVKVQYRRLRSALEQYYAADGRGHPSLLSVADNGFDVALLNRASLRAAERRRKPLLLVALGIAAALVIGAALVMQGMQRRKAVRQAVQLDQQARELLQEVTPSNAATGARLFEEALKDNSKYEPAWSGLASSLIVPGSSHDMSRTEALSKARGAALTAISLNAHDGMAHSSLAYVRLFQDRDWPAAEAEFQQAIQATPSEPRIHSMYAQGLMSRGRFDQAIAEARKAASLQPPDSMPTPDLAEILVAARKYDEAIAEARRVVAATNGSASAHIALGIALSAAGHNDQAIPEYRTALMSAKSLYVLARLGYSYGVTGDKVAAAGVLARLGQALSQIATIDWVYRALVYTGMGDKDHAIACLNNALANGEGDINFIGADPAYDSLRGDPRFIDLKKRAGLP